MAFFPSRKGVVSDGPAILMWRVTGVGAPLGVGWDFWGQPTLAKSLSFPAGLSFL